METLRFIFFLILGIGVVGGVGSWIVWMAFEDLNAKQEVKENNLTERVHRLRKQREAIRLENEIEDARGWAKLREDRIKAAKARLRLVTEKRGMESVLGLRALDELLGRSSRRGADPIQSARRKLVEVIENNKADGKETAKLEELLTTLETLEER